MTYLETIEDHADFFFHRMGVNVIPADTRNKRTYENWSQWQDQSIPLEIYEEWKRNNAFDKGMALIPGKIWRGRHEGKYLVAIDLDNKKAIEEFCRNGLEELKQKTLVEQHKDPNKMHVYFIVDRPIPNKSSDKVDTSRVEKIDNNDIPALEVKSNDKGIMYCSNSPHKNGSYLQLKSTLNPEIFQAKDVENRIRSICEKYNIPYGSEGSNGNGNGYQIPISELWKEDTIIFQGHNRHRELLRIMESLLQNNKKMPLDMIKQMAQLWNQKHCLPPLDSIEIERQWKDAIDFISKDIYSNGNGNGKNNYIEHGTQIKIRTLPEDKNYFEYLVSAIKKTVRCEDGLIRQILYTAFSADIGDDPINLAVLAPTSEGKTYAVTESLKYFPKREVENIGKMSPKALVRRDGIKVDKLTGEPIGGKVKELKLKIRELSKQKKNLWNDDKEGKAKIDDEIEDTKEHIKTIYENSKTLIDLTGKILLFLEPPDPALWELLKPILSHDSKEISFDFVDKDPTSNARTKEVVARGWPACIFCSAKDESKNEVWPEIKSRVLVTSPNMIPQKYKESNKLISQKKGLPKSIQQKLIISDQSIKMAKDCVLTIKDSIKELKSQNNDSISVWIPFYSLLQKELPENKGTDVRYVNRVFAFLDIIPIVKNNLRNTLLLGEEKSIIADIDDLKEVLYITQNFDGLPRYKAEFYNNVFLELYNQKTEPDSNEDGSKTEDFKAVTTRQLCDYLKVVNNKTITTDNLKKQFLNPLINEGLVDHVNSKLHGKQDIYYPLVTERISLLSNMNPFDYNSQQKPQLFVKIIQNMSETWLKSEINELILIEWSNDNLEIENYIDKDLQILSFDSDIVEEITQPVADFIKDYINKVKEHHNHEGNNNNTTPDQGSDTSDLDNNTDYNDGNSNDTDTDKKTNVNNSISDSMRKVPQNEPLLPKEAQISPKNPIFDEKDENSNSCKCYFCPLEFNTPEEYLKHELNKHPKEPAKPDREMIKTMRDKWGYDIEPKGNPWE